MIAIVVALSVSTFVLGFAALAVDLGSAYVRKAELQSVANRLALAGAKGLPTVVQPEGAIDQIGRALAVICADNPLAGVCDVDDDGNGRAPDPSWMTDGDPGNGEVTFYADGDGDTEYGPADQVFDLARDSVSTALQVKLAPSTVEFGLASAIGFASADVTKSASSRVGTPVGAGILPFALRPGDLENGQFCVRDPAFPLDPTPPTPFPEFSRVQLTFPANPDGSTQFPGGVPPETPGLTLRIQLTTEPEATLLPETVRFHFTHDREVQPGTPDAEAGTWVVPLPPDGVSGTTPQVWATGRERITTAFGTFERNFATNAETIFYSGDLPPGFDLCQQPGAARGFTQLARPGGGSVLESLAANVRTGPAVNLAPVDGPLGSVGSTLDCVATSFAPATSCLSVVPGVEFGNALASGFFTSAGPARPGRLLGECDNGTTSSGGHSGIDDSRLFVDSGFIDTRKGGSASALKNRLSGVSGSTTAGPNERGWVTSQVLGCPRLAVMPVIDPTSSVGGLGGKNITGFRYVWIDDDVTTSTRGLHFTDGRLDSFRGYVIDPGYLPAVVAGSKRVGPYLGGDMPKQVLLVPDLGGATP